MKNRRMPWKVLVACEFSGIVRDAFVRRGIPAVSCDLLPTERPGHHIVGDVSSLLQQEFDLCIAHPPCTRLCLSGVRWLHERNLWADMEEGARFFLQCLSSRAKRVAVENPIMHGYARALIGRPAFCVQPYHFGDNYTKNTCFWTRNLPALRATHELVRHDGPLLVDDDVVRRSDVEPLAWKLFFNEDGTRNLSAGKDRSVTYPGIAEAMADQWGKLLL